MFSYAESIDLIWPPWFIYTASLDILATLVLLHSFFQSLGNPNSLHRLSRIETLDPVRICFRYCENSCDTDSLDIEETLFLLYSHSRYRGNPSFHSQLFSSLYILEALVSPTYTHLQGLHQGRLLSVNMPNISN